MKPSNVLQDTTTGSWKLSDGGTTAIETQTSPTLLATSVLYAAPEMLLEQVGGSERSDLYSVGMMGLEAVLGCEGLSAAFPQVSNLQSPSRWLTWLEDPTREAKPLHEVLPETPERVSNFFSKLLAKDPGGRFASAFAATVELEAILAQLPSTNSEMPTYSAIVDTPTLLVGTQEGSRARLLISGPKGFDQQFELSDRTYRIGRDAQNDIVLPDDTKAVSRIHAELTRDGDRYVLTDLDSQNGLWVNGRRKPTVQLQAGVPVKLGGYTITLSAAAAETNPKADNRAPAKPASRDTAAAFGFGSAVRAWWPPKNPQQWAAVGSFAAVLIAGVLWIALRNPGPAVDSGAGIVAKPTPPEPIVLTAPDESLKQLRDLMSKTDYEGVLREAAILLTLYPQDKNVQALKQEAADSLAKSPATAPTTPAPPATVTQQNAPKAPGSRAGRGGISRTIVATPSTPPPAPERAAETEADALNRRIQAAVQDGQALESKGDLPAALRAFERAKNLEPASGEAHRLHANLRARMTAEGEQLFKNAKEDAAVGTLAKLIEAREGFTKAMAYLPDDHPMKQQAKDALARIK